MNGQKTRLTGGGMTRTDAAEKSGVILPRVKRTAKGAESS